MQANVNKQVVIQIANTWKLYIVHELGTNIKYHEACMVYYSNYIYTHQPGVCIIRYVVKISAHTMNQYIASCTEYYNNNMPNNIISYIYIYTIFIIIQVY